MKLPACTPIVLNALAGPIKSNLLNRNYVAAIAHVQDALAQAANEQAWCYETDPVLPEMIKYLEGLQTALSRFVASAPANDLVNELARGIEQTVAAQTHILREATLQETPDRYLSDDEVRHRIRKYSDCPEKGPSTIITED